MNCDLCRHRCKADCCRGPIPMPAELLDKHPHVRPATHMKETGLPGIVVAMHVTDDNRAVCPFLGLDDRCTIYEERPAVCRLFGNEESPFLTCSYQAADGRIRSRLERRNIEKEQVRESQRILRR